MPGHQHRCNGGESNQTGDPEHAAWLGIVDHRAKQRRRNDAADVEPGGDETEHFTDLAAWGNRADQHVARGRYRASEETADRQQGADDDPWQIACRNDRYRDADDKKTQGSESIVLANMFSDPATGQNAEWRREFRNYQV